jgi:hypothetical protein
MISDRANLARERAIVGRDEPAIAERAEVLARKEREARCRAHRAGLTATIGCANRLTRVLDHRNASTPRDLEDRIHLRAEAVEMDRHDRLRPRRQRSGDIVG